MKIGHIIRGWAKVLGFSKTSEAEKKMSELRLRLCGKCEWAKTSSILEMINGDLQYEMRLQCSRCHCPCLQKSLIAEEKCPVGNW